MDPADFYAGIVAELYGPLKAFSQDPEPCAAFVQAGDPGLPVHVILRGETRTVDHTRTKTTPATVLPG